MNEFSRASFMSFTFGVFTARHHDDGEGEALSSQRPNHFRAAHCPHAMIRDQDVGTRSLNVVKGFFRIGKSGQTAAWEGREQGMMKQEQVILVIFSECEAEMFAHNREEDRPVLCKNP